MRDSYEALAGAIVEQAVKDWRSAARKLRRRPRHEQAAWMKDDCEAFFRSGWFTVLTNVDGAFVLRKLEEEENARDE